MTKNRRMFCWLFLLVLLYAEVTAMAAAPAYAHYASTVVANTVVEPQINGMTSDCMVKAGDPSMTVLVGELDGPKEVSFWLKSNGSDAVGELLWSVMEPEKYLQYVQITMQIDGVTVDPGEKIDLLRDVPMSFDMTIDRTAVAKDTVHEELSIYVVVTWGDEMWGTFQVILPEVVQEEPPAEENKETENTPENPDSQNGDGAGETGENVSDNATRVINPNAMIQTASELEPESTDPTDPTETTDATEATEPVDPDHPVQLKTISRFDPAYALPVKATVSEDITSIRLGMEVTEGEETHFEPFPDYTRISLDHGKSYYMMYDGYIAELKREELTLEDGNGIPVLLDFAHTDIEEGDTLMLVMQTYAGSELKEIRKAETTADAREACLTLVHPLDEETGDVVFTAGDTRESAAEAGEFGWRSRTLNQNNALEFVLPMEWLDAEVEYSVELLTMTEDQTLEYVPVTLSEAGLYGKYQDFDVTHNLVLRIGEQLPRAGTYRLNMNWSYEGICFAKTQTTFFINYSAYTAQTLGG